MTYTSNSLTSANPAADLYTAIASALTSAGFTLVDTQVISTRTHKVWKSAGGSNSAALDWYLDVAYTTTGNGSVWLGSFEGYSTPNGLRGPYKAAATDLTTADASTFSRYGSSSSALETNWTHVAGNTAQIQCQTTAFAYFVSVTTDRVIAMTSVAPTSIAYCGLFDPFTPWANKCGSALYPLVTATVNSPAAINSSAHSSGGTAALTRRPPISDASNWTTAPSIQAAWCESGGGIYGSGYAGPVVPVDTASSLLYDAPHGGRLQIQHLWTTAGGNYVAIGLLKDVGVFLSNSVTRGDTITISGNTWVLSSTSSNRCYGFAAI